MGRRKRGSNKMGGGEALQDAVSDEETVGDDGLGVYDDVDNWEMQKDKVLLQATTTAAAGRGRQGAAGGHQREVFALSGTDSEDSDFDLGSARKAKEKRKKKKAQENEEEGEEGMADSDVEEGGREAGDDLRAWGTRKKHFYGGKLETVGIYLWHL